MMSCHTRDGLEFTFARTDTCDALAIDFATRVDFTRIINCDVKKSRSREENPLPRALGERSEGHAIEAPTINPFLI